MAGGVAAERDRYEENVRVAGCPAPAAGEAIVAGVGDEVLLLEAAQRLDLPQLAGGDPRPFEVVGIPLQPGFHVLEIASPILGQNLLDPRFKQRTMYVRTSALVTNLGVHFKWGAVNSGVWVTTLDKAKPVIFACNGAECWKSYKAAKVATTKGFQSVYWLRGGLPEWDETGLPTEGG